MILGESLTKSPTIHTRPFRRAAVLLLLLILSLFMDTRAIKVAQAERRDVQESVSRGRRRLAATSGPSPNGVFLIHWPTGPVQRPLKRRNFARSSQADQHRTAITGLSQRHQIS